jgi:hypothetical protein
VKLSKAQRSAMEWLSRGDDPFRRYGRGRPNCGTEATRRALLRLGLIETAHAGLDGLLDVDPATDLVRLTDAGRAQITPRQPPRGARKRP